MKIAMLGAGAIGSMLGMFLQEGGAEIGLVDPYKEHMDKISGEGLFFHSVSGEDMKRKMRTFYSADEYAAQCGYPDLIIVMMNGLISGKALGMAGAIIGPDTCVCTCQNGFGQEEALQKYFPDSKILMGVLGMSSVLIGPGEIRGNVNRKAGKVHMWLGLKDYENGPVEMAKQVVDYAVKGSLNAFYTDNIPQHIWEKAANNCACNALCAVERLTLEQIYELPEGKHLHNEILRELCEVGQARGIDINYEETLDAFENLTYPGVCKHYPSTAQDVFKKKPTEIDFLNGAITRYGKEEGIPTPYNDMITCLCKIIEKNYDNLVQI